MKTLQPLTDPVFDPPAAYSPLEKLLLRLLADKRDMPFGKLLFWIHCTVIPASIILYTPLLKGWQWWALALPSFYLSQFYFKGSFGLMLHCICHRKLFKSKYHWLYNYTMWFVCPFFGHLGDSYYSHHMGMHHMENNLPEDSSSTMRYQRDNWKHFIHYWLTFFFLGFRNTFNYLFGKQRKKFYLQLSRSEVGFYLAVTVLCFVNLRTTMWVFIIPFVFARLVMMLGNWAQHAFVDPHEPGNELASTVICINTKYNHKCWNDGYHAMHHLRPGAHFTEYPAMFVKFLPKLKQHKTLVFDGIHYLHIFVWLITKRYDKLAANMVNIDNTFESEAAAIALLKSRTARFDIAAVKKQIPPASIPVTPVVAELP